MGDTAEGKTSLTEVKKMNMDGVRYIRDRFNVPVTDEQVENLSYITFPEGSEEYKYLHERRQALKGYLPARQPNFTETGTASAGRLLSAAGRAEQKISTTIAFVRALNVMLKNKSIKDRLVPIIADEARTFGMEGLFRQIGIYSPNGQQYTPQDREQVAYYKEDERSDPAGRYQRAGRRRIWLAAATSYCTNNLPMIRSTSTTPCSGSSVSVTCAGRQATSRLAAS